MLADIHLSPFLLALLTIVGALVGAWVQHILGRVLETSKRLAQEKGKAYADYFRSVAASATQGRNAEFLSQAADAKTRICIYGSPGVALALSSFEKTGAKIDTAAGRAAIVHLMQEMRKDIGGRAQAIGTDELERILFGRTENQ